MAEGNKNDEGKPEDEGKLREGDFAYIITPRKKVETTSKTFPGLQQSLFGRYRVGRIIQVQAGGDGVDRTYIVDLGRRSQDGQRVVEKMSYMCM